MPIKYRTQTFYHIPNSPIILCFPKYSPPILPLGGDTPFCAFGYEIEDFYLTRKKTGRRYLRRVRIVTIVQAYVRIRSGTAYVVT